MLPAQKDFPPLPSSPRHSYPPMPPRLPIGTAEPESSLQSTCCPLLRQHSLPTQLLSQLPAGSLLLLVFSALRYDPLKPD